MSKLFVVGGCNVYGNFTSLFSCKKYLLSVLNDNDICSIHYLKIYKINGFKIKDVWLKFFTKKNGMLLRCKVR